MVTLATTMAGTTMVLPLVDTVGATTVVTTTPTPLAAPLVTAQVVPAAMVSSFDLDILGILLINYLGGGPNTGYGGGGGELIDVLS